MAPKLAENNNLYKLKEKEHYYSITVEAPLHILGFEEQDFSLFDYA